MWIGWKHFLYVSTRYEIVRSYQIECSVVIKWYYWMLCSACMDEYNAEQYSAITYEITICNVQDQTWFFISWLPSFMTEAFLFSSFLPPINTYQPVQYNTALKHNIVQYNTVLQYKLLFITIYTLSVSVFSSLSFSFSPYRLLSQFSCTTLIGFSITFSFFFFFLSLLCFTPMPNSPILSQFHTFQLTVGTYVWVNGLMRLFTHCSYELSCSRTSGRKECFYSAGCLWGRRLWVDRITTLWIVSYNIRWAVFLSLSF